MSYGFTQSRDQSFNQWNRKRQKLGRAPLRRGAVRLCADNSLRKKAVEGKEEMNPDPQELLTKASATAPDQAGQIASQHVYLRAAQAYMLISMPTCTSTIFGVFQVIRVLPSTFGAMIAPTQG